MKSKAEPLSAHLVENKLATKKTIIKICFSKEINFNC